MKRETRGQMSARRVALAVVALVAVPVVVACAKLGGLDDLTRVDCYEGDPCRGGADASIGDAAAPRDAADAKDAATRDADDLSFPCGERACGRDSPTCCADRDGGGLSCGVNCARDDVFITCLDDRQCIGGKTCCGQPTGLESASVAIIQCLLDCEWPVCAVGSSCDGGARSLSCKPTVKGAPYVCQE